MHSSTMHYALNFHSLWQLCLGQCILVEAVVDHKIDRGGEVGDVAAERLVGVGGNAQPREVQPIVWREGRWHIRVAIALVLPGGEAQLLKDLCRLLSLLVEEGRRMGVKQCALTAEQINILGNRVHSNSSFIQSKPRRSISVANSGPPVLTMRPPMSTCT